MKARIAQISRGCPPGVQDRALLRSLRRSSSGPSDTLRRALIEEIAAGHAGARRVPDALPLDPDRDDPAAAGGAHCRSSGMYYAGISSNIMSLAGIAIAIGVLVDAGIVVTENAFRFIEQRADRHRAIARGAGETVLESTRLVGRPVFFSMAIILLAFVPVFALTGQEGKLFHPLAFTKTFAVLAATIIAVTLVPVLCTLLLGGKVHAEDANPVMRGAAPAATGRRCEAALCAPRRDGRRSRRCCSSARSLLARGIGSEFMPPLNEGDLMFMPIADPSISLEENTRNRREAERRAA